MPPPLLPSFLISNRRTEGAPMAGGKQPAPSPISIGNCTLEIEGDGVVCKSSAKTLHISASGGAEINISVDDSSRKYMTRRSYNTILSSYKSEDGGGGCFLLEDLEFVLVNPKDVDRCSESVIQEVLKIYMEELPAMNYAANTGKESLFLERCISSGKFRTLVLRSNDIKGHEEVIAAVSFQIIPTDTQYAEIPLAAVSSKYQSKGIGHLLYEQLRERLQSVGILTIFCWADKESEGFWLKQGFISIGEVDSKGKARRLPIKADIRRALCFPGGSTLMVSHLKKDTVTSIDSPKYVTLCSLKSHSRPPDSVCSRAALSENRADYTPNNNSPNETINNSSNQQIGNPRSQLSMKNGHSAEDDAPGAFRLTCGTNFASSSKLANSTARVDPGVLENWYGTDDKDCSYGQRFKRRVWEASLSSLKSKRVRGGHLIDCCQDAKQDISCDHVKGNNSTSDDCSLGINGCKLSVDVLPKDPTGLTVSGTYSEEKRSGCANDPVVLEARCPRIMLMNIADDAKKTSLNKIVGELGGSVTCNGSASTHIITGKARRTLNFCVALCSGAWIVSPQWLKASFREGKFVGELQYLLEDDEYRLKYKSELKVAVMRAKENPHSLLRGFYVCLAKHIQPSAAILSAIIKSAGGNVIRKLDSIQEASRTIFVACEEDMEVALVVAKKGAWTFSSDWLMSCVMKQELDFEAPQFAESL